MPFVDGGQACRLQSRFADAPSSRDVLKHVTPWRTRMQCNGTAADKLSPSTKASAGCGRPLDTTAICAPTGLTCARAFQGTKRDHHDGTVEDADGRSRRSDTGRHDARHRKLEGYATIFLRRILFRPWFRLIARVGRDRSRRYILTRRQRPNTDPQSTRRGSRPIAAGRSFSTSRGAIGVPWLNDRFYRTTRARRR